MNPEGADPILRERQRRTKSVGPHYPDPDDYNIGDEGVLRSFDKVELDGRQYKFLGYYEKKDWMMFRCTHTSGLDPDKKISKKEFEELRYKGKFERIQYHEDDSLDEMEELRLAILPDWIENKELFADRLYGDRDLVPFIGFDEERRAVTIDECKIVHHNPTTPNDILRNHEDAEREDYAYQGLSTEGIVKEIINEDWDWIHPQFRWLLKSPKEASSVFSN